MYDGTDDEMADEIQMSCGNQNELGYFQQKYSPLLGSLDAGIPQLVQLMTKDK
jgi:hypothetical protein